MLIWTRDTQRLAFQTLQRDVTQYAVERTPLWLRAKWACRWVDAMLFTVLCRCTQALRALRRWTWAVLRSVDVAQSVKFLGLWCEWMAIMVLTSIALRFW